MATANTLESHRVRIWRGIPGAAAPAFLVCALVTRGLQQTKQTNTAVIPDCADPAAVAPVKRTVLSKDCTMSGEGYYEPDIRDDLQTAYDDKLSLPWSFEFLAGTPPLAVSVGWYTGNWFLTTLGFAAAQGEYVRSELAWEADGAITWTAAP